LPVIGKMYRTLQILTTLLILTSCNNEDIYAPIPESKNSTFISAVDISSYPEISYSNPTFYDLEGNQNDFLTILKDNGVNTVRLRLWVNPSNEHSGFKEVKQFSNTLKTNGF
jgi:arabinogalactan endo-1,4-beta-galactosidase